MKTPVALLPDRRTLATRLANVFNGNGSPRRRVAILARGRPEMMSTFPNEVVKCRLPDGRARRVFIKYEAGRRHDAFGHRGGVAYEAAVYRQVLGALPGFRPRCLGTDFDSKSGGTWLVLECLDRCVRVSDIQVNQARRQPRAVAQMARWLGEFHATHEARAASGAFPFLHRYDARYFRGWARRTAEYTQPLCDDFPWLAGLCQRSAEWAAPLLAAPPTIIHGEFYAKTVLLRRNQIFPVDWESAAIAAGEIDLAALTEGTGWTAKLVQRCEREYQRARWPEGAPADFHQRLEAARIYLHFRWLGERPDWAVRLKTRWRYEHLYAVATRFGLI